MATSSNTIKTRIQLKSDTEANWRKSVLKTDNPNGEKNSGTSFVPLLGELIVFSADSTHPFSRLKIGDGSSNVLNLPFIDAGTLDGSKMIRISSETAVASIVEDWRVGSMPTFTNIDGILKIKNGVAPSLTYT